MSEAGEVPAAGLGVERREHRPGERIADDGDSPGLIRTAMTAALREDLWEHKIAAIPMGRAGDPDEVANVALFLASPLSSYVTGAVLEVTGGRDM